MFSLEKISKKLSEGFNLALSLFNNPDKRVYLLYLFSSALIAGLVYLKAKKHKTNFFSYLFALKVWWSKSARIDYYFILFNSYVKVLLIGPYLISGFYLAFYVNDFMISLFGYNSLSISTTTILILYTIVLTIVSDFSSFFVHYLMHKVPFFWEFHKVHHSAEVLNPATQYRIHPVELIINNVRGIIVFGIVTGVFDYFSPAPLNKLTIIGINAFHFLFLLFGANLRHSHVKLKYWDFLELILISPFQHQIHHSNHPDHFDKNMGSKFALWDWMFGTLIRSKEVNRVRFGLGNEDEGYGKSFLRNLFMPFMKSLKLIFNPKNHT